MFEPFSAFAKFIVENGVTGVLLVALFLVLWHWYKRMTPSAVIDEKDKRIEEQNKRIEKLETENEAFRETQKSVMEHLANIADAQMKANQELINRLDELLDRPKKKKRW